MLFMFDKYAVLDVWICEMPALESFGLHFVFRLPCDENIDISPFDI